MVRPSGDFDPNRIEFQDRAACRARWNLPLDVPLALFAGVPQPHKGWTILLDALSRPETRAWHLVLAGPAEHPDFAAAADALGARCHRIGPQPNDRMPALLAAVDAVPVPQLNVPFSQSQLPAKALEAMAMARAVIATRVGDLPGILGDDARGWLIPPGDATALAAAFADIASRPEEARARGAAARAWFLENASEAVIESTLAAVIDSVTSDRDVVSGF